MIANEHFLWLPEIPTLHRERAPLRPTQGAALHAENRGGIDRYADRPVCRPGRSSGDHLCLPDCRSRVNRLESALTSIQRRIKT